MRHPIAISLLIIALAACGRDDAGQSQQTADAGGNASVPANTAAPAPGSSSSDTATASSGSNSSDTAAAAATTPPATTAAADPSRNADGSQRADSSGAGGASATAAGGKGQDVYGKACVACHAAGVAGAPKLGDTADWKPRIAQGKNVLYEHAIKGYQGKKGMMPPKGGATNLPDDDVKAAVDYMVASAGGK